MRVSLAASVLLLLVTIIDQIESGNILMWMSTGSKSHYNLMKPLAMALAKRNHTLTMVVFQGYPELEAMKNVRYIKVATDVLKYMNSTDIFEGGDPMKDMALAAQSMSENQRIILETPGIQALMKENPQFDVTIIDSPWCHDLGLYLAKEKFNSSIIQFLSPLRFPNVDLAMGNPITTSYIPMEMIGYSQHMTFKERLFNTVITGLVVITYDYYFHPTMGEVLKELLYLDEAPNIRAMSYDAAFSFVNAHAVFENVVPVNPNTAWIGGIHLDSTKLQPLPSDLKKYMDEAKDGVILVSFGTVLTGSQLPESKRKILIDTFSKLKQKVIWKWETEDMEDKPANVMLKSWLPQQDILAHPNVRLFVTHGGLLSTEEALYFKVPVVVMPGFADQFANSAKTERMGFGKEIRWTDLDNKNLLEAIETVLSDPTYKENAKYFGAIFSDNIVSSLDKAVFHTEYVMRHKGAPHLRSPAKDLYWFQYFLLDVFAFIAVAVFGTLYILYQIVKVALGFLCGKKNKTEKVKKN